MKHLVSTPLIVTAAVIACAAAALIFNLPVMTPNALGVGAGLATCAGLFAMLGTDSRSNRCC